MQKKKIIQFSKLALILLVVFGLIYTQFVKNPASSQDSSLSVHENESYTSKEEVALYIVTYHKLPSNYITKSQAVKLGWIANEGNLWEVTDKKSIGGDIFSNREGILPKKSGLKYYEADIDYHGGHRNGKRIVYSNEWKVYYTDDHYQTFQELY